MKETFFSIPKRKRIFLELAISVLVVFSLYMILSVYFSASKEDSRKVTVLANIQTIFKQSEIYYISNSEKDFSYGKEIGSCLKGVFSDKTISKIILNISKNIRDPREITCETSINGEKWAMEIDKPYKSGILCIDSEKYVGVSKGIFDGTCTK